MLLIFFNTVEHIILLEFNFADLHILAFEWYINFTDLAIFFIISGVNVITISTDLKFCIILDCPSPSPTEGYQYTPLATCLQGCVESYKGDSNVRGAILYTSCESK